MKTDVDSIIVSFKMAVMADSVGNTIPDGKC